MMVCLPRRERWGRHVSSRLSQLRSCIAASALPSVLVALSGIGLRARLGSSGPKAVSPQVRALPDTLSPTHPFQLFRPLQHHPEEPCALTVRPDPDALSGASHRPTAPSRSCDPHPACLPIIVRPSEPFRSSRPLVRIAAPERWNHPFRPVHNTGLHPNPSPFPVPGPGGLSSYPHLALHRCNCSVFLAFSPLSVCPSDLLKVSREPSRSQQKRMSYPQAAQLRCG